MKLLPNFLFLIFIVLIASFVCVAQNRGARFQISFGIEERIRRPQKIPAYVVRQIAAHERKGREPFTSSEIAEFASRIEGTLVNLDYNGNADFLVQGDDGANITGFWVFRKVKNSWKLVLASRAAWLKIGTKKTKNLRNIAVSAASAIILWTVDYRFNGRRYFPVRCGEEPINEPKKRKRIVCSDTDKPYR